MKPPISTSSTTVLSDTTRQTWRWNQIIIKINKLQIVWFDYADTACH